MYLLVDYENVSMNGLQGIEYINSDDKIVLFCNKSQTIRQDMLDLLSKSGADIEYVSLVKKGKNGLDFYIACKVGELIERGINEKLIIVSHDNGFCAVIDYCKKNGFHSIYRANNIENAIKITGGERQQKICYRTKTLNLCTAIDLINQEKKQHQKLTQCLAPVMEYCLVEDIEKIVKETHGKRERYLTLLKKYGRNIGLKVYRCIRDFE